MNYDQIKEAQRRYGELQKRKPIIDHKAFEYFLDGYEACLEANGIGEDIGRYRIGDVGEGNTDEGWTRARICAIADRKNGFTIITKPEDFRPIPAWKPQDGEAVIFTVSKPGFMDPDYTMAGVYNDGYVVSGIRKYEASYLTIKPFDSSKIGIPSGEL